MAEFDYKGRSGRGELVTGRLEGDTPDAVAARLFNSGITPIEINPVDEAAETLGDIWRKLGGGRPTDTDLILFSRQMHTITRSGVPLLQGIRGIMQTTRNIVLREALQEILHDLEAGRDLAGSLGRHPEIFPPLYVNLIRVGETTGTMDEAFLRIYEHLSVDKDIRDRVKQAVRYPIIVMIAIGLAITVLTLFVIPRFEPLFAALDEVPLPTQIIMGAADFATNYWFVVLGGIAAIALAIRYYVRTPDGRYRWDRSKLRIPVVGSILLRASLARLCRSLSISLNAGMPIVQALNIIARATNNAWMEERVLSLRDGVERGESLSRTATTVQLFTPLVLQMIAIGEETGAVPELLNEVADSYEREVDYELKNLSAALEPILILGLGVMVLILALGVFLPMWDFVGRARGM